MTSPSYRRKAHVKADGDDRTARICCGDPRPGQEALWAEIFRLRQLNPAWGEARARDRALIGLMKAAPC